MTEGTTTPPASDYRSWNDGETVLKVQVYSEWGAFSAARHDDPRFEGGRPDHFPDSIDVLMWGALSASTQTAVRRYERKNIIMLTSLLFVFLAGWFLVPALSAWTLEWILICLVVAFALNRRLLLPALEEDMQKVVQDLSSYFIIQAGYKLDYVVERSDTCYFYVHYLRLAALDGLDGTEYEIIEQGIGGDKTTDKGDQGYGYEESSGVLTTASSQNDPLPIVTVTIYEKWYMAICRNAFLHRLEQGRPKILVPHFDISLWGALAESVEQYSQKLRQRQDKRVRALVVLALLVALLEPWHGSQNHGDGSISQDPYSTHRRLIQLLLIIIATWFYVMMEYKDELDAREANPQWQGAVDEWGPLLQQQTGYAVQYRWKQSFWLPSQAYLVLCPRASMLPPEAPKGHVTGPAKLQAKPTLSPPTCLKDICSNATSKKKPTLPPPKVIRDSRSDELFKAKPSSAKPILAPATFIRDMSSNVPLAKLTLPPPE